MSISSCFFRDATQNSELKEYLVVGTAFVLPEEQQPSRGRLLVFELLTDSASGGRMVRLVVETPTRGAVFSLSSLNGKLVAGIDSKVSPISFPPFYSFLDSNLSLRSFWRGRQQFPGNDSRVRSPWPYPRPVPEGLG
jgi:hypothetical protein